MTEDKLDAQVISEQIAQISDIYLSQSINILVLDTVDSTNNHLLELLQSPIKPSVKTVVITEQQTAGKGCQGRAWVSPPGNVYLTFYWQFQCAHVKLYGLSIVVGIAIARVLYANGLLDIKLKWPNDIFWQLQKMGGILIETKTAPAGAIDTVIGIGLNMRGMQNLKTQISQDYVTLENALQTDISRNILIAQLLVELNLVLAEFANAGFDPFIVEWQKFSIQPGEKSLEDQSINRIL